MFDPIIAMMMMQDMLNAAKPVQPKPAQPKRTKPEPEMKGIAIPIPADMSEEDIINLIPSIILSQVLADAKDENNRKPKTAAKESECGCRCPKAVNAVAIKDVNFYGTTVVIKWTDGTKTIAVCDKEDTYTPQTGFAIAIAKKFMGNQNFHDALVEYVYPQLPDEVLAKSAEKATETNADEKAPEAPVEKKTTAKKSTTKKTTSTKSTKSASKTTKTTKTAKSTKK